MARVIGIGGIFFKARDPEALLAWYATHLGLEVGEGGTVAFRWRDGQTETRPGTTAFAVFGQDTTYFAPSESPFMVNFRVDDLTALLESLRSAGVTVEEPAEGGDGSEFGRFAWVMDPEGNRIELWEPADE